MTDPRQIKRQAILSVYEQQITQLSDEFHNAPELTAIGRKIARRIMLEQLTQAELVLEAEGPDEPLLAAAPID